MLHLQDILIQSVCETVYGYLLTYPFELLAHDLRRLYIKLNQKRV